jgi:hypothetical protein
LIPVDRVILVTALAVNGLLAGATLDQAIKQLPARRHIGVEAFSAYSQAADLSNGVAWYASLGIGAAVLTLAAVITGLRARRGRAVRRLLWIGAVATVAHMAVTAVAAPVNFSQRRASDAAALANVFDTFELLNAARAFLQILVLATVTLATFVQLRTVTAVSRSAGQS